MGLEFLKEELGFLDLTEVANLTFCLDLKDEAGGGTPGGARAAKLWSCPEVPVMLCILISAPAVRSAVAAAVVSVTPAGDGASFLGRVGKFFFWKEKRFFGGQLKAACLFRLPMYVNSLWQYGQTCEDDSGVVFRSAFLLCDLFFCRIAFWTSWFFSLQRV